MLKRCVLFASSFVILHVYLQSTGFLAGVGNSVLFIGFEILLALALYLLGKKLNIFAIRKLNTNDWLIYISGFVAHLFSLGLTEFIEISSGSTRFDGAVDEFAPIYLMYGCVFAPIMEEVIFRGFIQKGSFNNSYPGIVVAATIFSLMHRPDNFLSFIPYFLTGLILGYMVRRSDQLGPAILLHITINTLPTFMN